jgi:hypothetical protein
MVGNLPDNIHKLKLATDHGALYAEQRGEAIVVPSETRILAFPPRLGPPALTGGAFSISRTALWNERKPRARQGFPIGWATPTFVNAAFKI